MPKQKKLTTLKQKPVFKAQGYLEKTYLDKQGGKHVTFEFSSRIALELAKLELMSRDLVVYQPTLLDIVIKQSNITQKGNIDTEKKPKIERRKFKG